MFVEKANLPHNAETVLVGEKYAEILAKPLNKLGLTPEIVPNNPLVDERLSGHADLSLLHTGGERTYLAPYLSGSELSKRLLALGAEITYADIEQRADYPFDAQLNMCPVGKVLLCCLRANSSEIVDYLTSERGFKTAESRQGYSRCSVCPVDEGSIITADASIAEAAGGADMEVLKICEGTVALPGFDYGFIGGAAFKISDGVMGFTGVLDRLPDRDAILGFLRERCIEHVFLTDEPIFDVGGIIPLTEKGTL